MDAIILFALPVFGLLMAAEWLYGRRVGRDTYRLHDSVASLSQGLLSQAVALPTQLFQVGLYTLAYRKLALFAHAPLWHTAAGWLLAVLMFDFCDYWLHRVGHETGIFWAAHVVHHQSEFFNFSTALRQESLVPLLGWAFYLPMAVAGVPPAQFVVAGLVVLIYQFWIHTEHIGKLGWFDRVFSSPSNHRVHHAVNPQYINKNYGGMLVLWDRLFGTFAEEGEPCVYGTQAPLASFDPLAAVGQVYGLLAQDAVRASRWRDKLRIWFMPTGWRPPDVAARWPRPAFELAAVVRHDPTLSPGQAVYAVVAFAMTLAATGGLLWQADEQSYGWLLLACAGVAAGLWLPGRVLQGRMGLLPAWLLGLLVWLGVGWVLLAVG